MRRGGTGRKTGRRVWINLIGLALAAVAGVSVWQAIRADQRANRRRLAQALRDTQPRGTVAAGVDVNAGDLLSGTWDALQKRGLSALRAGRFHDAELGFRSAAALAWKRLEPQTRQDRSKLSRDPEYVASFLHLADVNRLLGRNVEAQRLLSAAGWHGEDRLHVAERVCFMGLSFDRGPSNWSGGDDREERAAKIYGANSGERLRLLSHRARLSAHNGDLHEANLLLGQAADIVSAGQADDLSVGTYQFCRGWVYLHHECLAQAAACLTEALARLEKALPDNHPDLAEARAALGDCCRRTGKTTEARQLIRKALRTYEDLRWPPHPRVGDVLVALGKAHDADEEYAVSRDLYRKAADNYQAAIKPPRSPRSRPDTRLSRRLATALRLGADARIQLGDHAGAAAQLTKAAEVLERAFAKRYRQVETTGVYRRLGRCYLALKQYDRAVDALKKVPIGDVRNRASHHPLRVADREALAEAHRLGGQGEEAEEIQRQARLIRAAYLGPKNDDPGKQLLWDAKLDAAAGQYDRALDKMLQRHRLRRPILASVLPACPEKVILEAARREAWASHYMFSTAFKCSDPAQAAGRVLEVDMAYKSMAMDAQADQLAAVHASSDLGLRKLAEQVERLRRRIAACTLTSDASDPMFAPAGAEPPTTRPEDFSPLASSTAPSSQPAEAKMPPGSSGYRLVKTIEHSVSLEAEPGVLPGNVPMRTRLGQLEAELAKQCAPLARLSKLRSLDRQAFDRALPEDAAFISYIHVWNLVEPKGFDTQRQYVALLVRKRRPAMLFVLGNPFRIDGEVERFMRTLDQAPEWIRQAGGEAKAECYVRERATRVSRLLLYPLWPHIKDCKRLIICPDGMLSELPFHLLQRPAAPNRYLIESHRISYVASARDVLDFARQTPGGAGALVLADPDFDSVVECAASNSRRGIDTRHLAGLRWNALPATRSEAKSVAGLLREARVPVTVKTGTKATKSSLLDAGTPRFLHVATHGFFLPDPSMSYNADPIFQMGIEIHGRRVEPANPLLYSGLALAGANGADGIRNGVVTAYEMKWINLWGTELVTLSACETGLGGETHGAGVRGLRQVLLQAGARRIVTSLWKVPDKQTAELMEAFYRRLLKGRPADAALREAMLEVRDARLDAHPAAHPYLWGGFVLIGDPSAVPAGRVEG